MSAIGGVTTSIVMDEFLTAQALRQARKALDEWIAIHAVSVAHHVESQEAEAMALNLLRLVDGVRLQLSAIGEQLSQEKWAEREPR